MDPYAPLGGEAAADKAKGAEKTSAQFYAHLYVALWYDAEGERKGPPMNYWRQAADERYHSKSLAAIDAVARGADDAERHAPAAGRTPR